LGIQTVETGVFGGIIPGNMTAILHNKYHKVVLPPYLGFFGGSGFVPIVTAFAAIFLGVLMFFIWPSIQAGIYHVGRFVTKTGAIGTFVYGFILRLLGPLGLHHIFY
ncbi:PTS transporter subunit EIIC, partial [Listeria monocytogenes]|uniref:PTS transporter subunit EIIC n=1 Tax=Listeria monocytogenes TaxID=1639 RepID=UPI000A69BFFD